MSPEVFTSLVETSGLPSRLSTAPPPFRAPSTVSQDIGPIVVQAVS